MASIQARTSRGIKYWSIVESRRINGEPRTVILEYLGTAESLLQRLQEGGPKTIKSYSHGDSASLLNIVSELNVVNIINKYIPAKTSRDGLTVGASMVLAAIGRACHPTSKQGWYNWCKETSLEYCLRMSLSSLNSQHFWDQMQALPSESIAQIEDEIVRKLIETYDIDLDCLFFDTTNFFTFIDSENERCDIPQRGKNKQKRCDLRQIGTALLVTRKDQFPLFHHTYRGNKNDYTVFKEGFTQLKARLKSVCKELSDITLVFDKGNNSRDNFALLAQEKDLHYVGGLVPHHFKTLITEANKNFQTMKIDGEDVPVYRIKRDVWGEERTCVVTISEQLRQGQIAGINQHLEKKAKELEEFKQQLENPKRRKAFSDEEIKQRLKKIIKGQFVEDILKYELISVNENNRSFTYYVDQTSFEHLKNEILGRKILFTNRHDWSNEAIILAYRGQSKVEYAFRNLKNPYHLAVRPQYHWTDQKIEVHLLICIVGYLLSVAVYTKARDKGNYDHNLSNLMEELRSIRLTCVSKKKSNKVAFQLEQIPPHLQKIANILGIRNDNLRPNINFSDYN